jgi:hypothetical protein
MPAYASRGYGSRDCAAASVLAERLASPPNSPPRALAKRRLLCRLSIASSLAASVDPIELR